MKVNSKIYRGIEYVQLNELPKEQKERIFESLAEDTVIKIMIDEIVVGNCIQYKDYELWFDNVYRKAVQVTSVKKERVPDTASIAMAIEKF